MNQKMSLEFNSLEDLQSGMAGPRLKLFSLDIINRLTEKVDTQTTYTSKDLHQILLTNARKYNLQDLVLVLEGKV